MATRIDKKFITNCIEKYPEVKKHYELFGLTINDVKRVLSENYSYKPVDLSILKGIKDSSNTIIKLHLNETFSDIDTAFDHLCETLKTKFCDSVKEVGFDKPNMINNISIQIKGSDFHIKFDGERSTTIYDRADIRVNEVEKKSLYEISHLIKSEYKK